MGEALPVPTIPPGLEVTVYPVIVEPFADGAVKEIVALPPVEVAATTFVGASGYVARAINDWLALEDCEPYTTLIWNQ